MTGSQDALDSVLGPTHCMDLNHREIQPDWPIHALDFREWD